MDVFDTATTDSQRCVMALSPDVDSDLGVPAPERRWGRRPPVASPVVALTWRCTHSVTGRAPASLSGQRCLTSKHSVHFGRTQIATSDSSRAPRSDATQNRETILRVAREEFAQGGLSIPVSQIIAATGLGRATFYRNFASKEELLRSIFEDSLMKLRRVRDAASPEDALFAIIRAGASMQETILPLSSALSREGSPDLLRSLTADLDDLVRDPLRFVQAAGLVRADLAADDIIILFTMIGGAAVFRPGKSTIHHRERALSFALDAIRPARE